MIRLAANLSFLWPDRPLVERIRAARKAGFRAVEFQFPYEVPSAVIKAELAANHLIALGINTPPGRANVGELGFGAVEGREDDFERSIDEAIAYARGCGAAAIHVMAGNVETRRRPAGRDVFVQNLRYTLEKMNICDKRSSSKPCGIERQKLTFLLEPLNRYDHPMYFYSSVAEVAEIIDEIAAPQLRLQFDVYHVARGGADPIEQLCRYYSCIGHVQIAGLSARNEPDTGWLDYRRIFAVLEEIGYEGWVGCEYRPVGDTDVGLSWISRLIS